MKIIVDAMGGDKAPHEIVRGAVLAASELGAEIILVGRAEDILQVLKDDKMGEIPRKIEISHASQVIGMDENPAVAIREKKDSSIVRALSMLAEGAGDALVSAGSTGAILTGSTLTAKRIRGIRRAALAPVIPTVKGGALLIDCGANVECTPEYLLQFAYMGSFYAERVLNRKNPKVSLLNIGQEETKGTPLHKETFLLLKRAGEEGRINFIGNIEGRDVTSGVADVIVSDGFSGNVMLKTMEGIGMFFTDLLKELYGKSLLTKLSALMVKSGLSEFRKLINYKETGGAPLLGISKPIIKAHGSSDAYAIRSAIKQALSFASSGIVEEISKNIQHMKVSSN